MNLVAHELIIPNKYFPICFQLQYIFSIKSIRLRRVTTWKDKPSESISSGGWLVGWVFFFPIYLITL